MKTREVKKLVEEALCSLQRPHTEDVIEYVFHVIQKRSEWRERYEGLCQNLGKDTVNQWGGKWIRKALDDPRVIRSVKSRKRAGDVAAYPGPGRFGATTLARRRPSARAAPRNILGGRI